MTERVLQARLSSDTYERLAWVSIFKPELREKDLRGNDRKSGLFFNGPPDASDDGIRCNEANAARNTGRSVSCNGGYV